MEKKIISVVINYNDINKMYPIVNVINKMYPQKKHEAMAQALHNCFYACYSYFII